MKTFETEKHNIPEGATHTYDYGGNYCGYYKVVDGNWFYWGWSDSWCFVVDNQCFYDATPIPQTKEVGWLGVGCIVSTKSYGDGEVIAEAFVCGFSKWLVQFKDTYRAFDREDLAKPETQEDREKREREENGKAFYERMGDIEISVMNPEDSGYPNLWGELRNEWKEVYMLQAKAVGYRKGGE